MKSNEIINCKPISPGIVEGIVVNIKTINELDNAFGKIIAFDTNDFLFATKLAFSKNYKGAISKNSCKTSHISVLLREGGVPAVSTEVDFEDGDVISMNGTTGEVIIK